jgi:hypothetical protein|tara:strand:- start:1050 stop:1223 length:174 start_codon:yes stop_codon:yes gene_type:complete
MLNKIDLQKINNERRCRPENHTSYCVDYKKPYCKETCDYANERQQINEKENIEKYLK